MNKIIGLLFTCLIFSNCSKSIHKEYIITVNGKIPVKKMGISLIHEHVMVDFIGADSTGYHRWNRSEVVSRAHPFLLAAKDKGPKTMFECTPAFVGRDPILLKELSDKTGIHMVTNTGYYGARKNKYLPPAAFNLSAEDLANIWIDEFNNGIENTGIFPGFIKISVDSDDILSPIHEKIVKAAAIAHKSTGMTIVSHTGNDGPAMAQLKVLKEKGVSANAFVWTHAQAGSLSAYIDAAKQGAWISIDNINKNNQDKPGGIEWLIPILKSMKNENLMNKVLLSHDSGWYHVGEKNGGNYNGYTDIFEFLIPALYKNGFSKKDIELLFIKNPAKAYALNIRQLK